MTARFLVLARIPTSQSRNMTPRSSKPIWISITAASALKAAKLVKPDAHFHIRTSVGVAGVVGTDMVVIFDPTAVIGNAISRCDEKR